MAARRLQSADRGFKVRESGAVVVTRPRKFMQDGQVQDIEAVVTLLGGRLSLHGPGNTAWLRLCAEMQAWLRVHEAKLARLLGGDRRQWKAHRELSMRGTLGLCLAMQFTRSRWVRSHFLTMLRQHRVHTSVDLARAMSLAHASPSCTDDGVVGYSPKRAYAKPETPRSFLIILLDYTRLAPERRASRAKRHHLALQESGIAACNTAEGWRLMPDRNNGRAEERCAGRVLARQSETGASHFLSRSTTTTSTSIM